MRYVKPAVGTVCVGSAYGEAALLLAAGEKVPTAVLYDTSQTIASLLPDQIRNSGTCSIGGNWQAPYAACLLPSTLHRCS
jgi:Clp protease